MILLFILRHTAQQMYISFKDITIYSILHSHVIENITFVYLKWYLS